MGALHACTAGPGSAFLSDAQSRRFVHPAWVLELPVPRPARAPGERRVTMADLLAPGRGGVR